MQINYELYNADQFLADNFFVEWVKYKTPETEKFWINWMESQPANLQVMKEAESQLKFFLSARRIEPGSNDVQLVWQKILSSIDLTDEKVFNIRRNRRKWLAAASIAGLLLISGVLWLTNARRSVNTTIATNYGEMKIITLPDHSEITLNAHSKIRYLKRWNDTRAREVWLEGEAFFSVKHLNKNQDTVKENDRFIVHTNLVEVEVLGTVFNVKERRDKVMVSLETGSVKVVVNADSTKMLFLQPGELAVYEKQTGVLRKVAEDPAIHKAWTDKKMLANNTSVNDVIQALEDTYGYKVILEDTTLGKRTIDGPIPFKSENSVLFVLSNMFNLDVEKKGNTLILKSRK